MQQPPDTGDIELVLDFDLASLNNGEKRIVSSETGIPIQGLVRSMQAAGGEMINVEDFDTADLEYAFGRIALRRKYGVEADTPANADRVSLSAAPADPTPAS